MTWTRALHLGLVAASMVALAVAWPTGADAQQAATQVQIDNDDNLVIDLTWGETDHSAGADLEDSCRRFGVDRSHVQR